MNWYKPSGPYWLDTLALYIFLFAYLFFYLLIYSSWLFSLFGHELIFITSKVILNSLLDLIIVIHLYKSIKIKNFRFSNFSKNLWLINWNSLKFNFLLQCNLNFDEFKKLFHDLVKEFFYSSGIRTRSFLLHEL